MDHGACNIIYLDRRAREELVKREFAESGPATGRESPGYFKLGNPGVEEVHNNIRSILTTFNQVVVCRSGVKCLSKLSKIHDASTDNIPIIVLIDIPYDEEQRIKRLSREPRTPSPTSTRRQLALSPASDPEDIYGIHLLAHIASEIQSHVLSKLVIPVVVLSGFDGEGSTPNAPSASIQGPQILSDTIRLVKYLDAGAVDVLMSPLSKDQVHGLAVHAYRVYKEVTREETSFLANKRNRKVSWVGVEEKRPYAYLREAMVSNLMNRICTPEATGELWDPSEVAVSSDRQEAVAAAIGTWSFSAHAFSDDELLYGAKLMLQHALQMPELERWRLREDDLTIFLLASRTAYNNFVLYHNFRHVTDVLQAMFFFLVRIGILPPYPAGAPSVSSPPSAIATLLKPFDALTLLISAIGHDVGHPGVNNAFLVALNSPLAQLYNDRSVLESFHCAAYSQILRRYWPLAFADTAMRKLMINSILATDMGLHFKYMSDLGNLQEKFAHNNKVLDGWSVKQLEDYKDLTCGLLIKCADICNVARKFDIAAEWASVLTDEFSNQGNMEKELNMPTCLFGGPPVRDNIIKMGESQIGFMNIFARPLFEAVTDILPAMQFAVDEILINKRIWEGKISDEKEKLCVSNPNIGYLRGGGVDGAPSPMNRSHADLSETKEHVPAIPDDVSRIPPTNLSGIPARTSDSTVRSSFDSPTRVTAASSSSRRSSFGPATSTDVTSRRSSNGVIGQNGFCRTSTRDSVHNQSRRGSADASLTTIVVTHTANGTPDRKKKRETMAERLRSLSPAKRKQNQSPEKNGTSYSGSESPLTLTEPVMQPPADQRYPSSTHSHPDYLSVPGEFPSPDPSGACQDGDVQNERPRTSTPEKSRYLTSVMTGSSGSQEPTVRHRTSKFGLSRFWKKRWRSDAKSEEIPHSPG